MPHLRKLHLNLTQTRVSSDSASELCESLKELRELEILKLYFTDCASVGLQFRGIFVFVQKRHAGKSKLRCPKKE